MSEQVAGATAGISEVRLPEPARAPLLKELEGLRDRFGHAASEEFLVRAPSLGALLPEELRGHLRGMRYTESSAVMVVRGAPEFPDPGPTPRNWRDRDGEATPLQDFWLVLLASQLGDAVSWSTLQEGNLLGDIVPVPGREKEQTGHGSDDELVFHVEDAFSDDRCDHLALMCLRAGAPTTVATSDCLDLERLDLDTLFSERFVIAPDPEHVRGAASPVLPTPPVPVLTGTKEAPHLRVDQAFTEPLPGDTEAAEAYRDLLGQLEAGLTGVGLGPGDVLLVDNHRAVHGRRSFTPRYDGTDRWLRRATTVRDLRKSRGSRGTVNSRVVVPHATADA